MLNLKIVIVPPLEKASPSPRQLKLFHLESRLTERLGSGFFRSLPAVPGVYFFSEGDGQLLYIGQSANLRARVGSYRQVSTEKHSRRILRLDGTCMDKHRHKEWLKFQRLIERSVPKGKEIHIICDNYATHKHAKVKV